MDEIAPMLVGITLILTTGGVILLRPISKRLGTYLELLADERRARLNPAAKPTDTARIVALLENMEERIARIEDRQEFTDRLLTDRGAER